MLGAGTDVWISGLDCFGTITTIYHFMFEDMIDVSPKLCKLQSFQFKHEHFFVK